MIEGEMYAGLPPERQPWGGALPSLEQEIGRLNAVIQAQKIHLEAQSAEIERLNAKVESVRVELRQQWERMQKENLALKDRVTEKDKLITECADALEDANAFVSKRTRTMDEELWTRGREAAKQ
jgi:chromosome segregation ATPase